MNTETVAEQSHEIIVHLEWEGPLTLAEAFARTDRKTDYGIYQVYGTHPVYGSRVLLYIGKAARQPLGVRLEQETWRGWQAANGAVSVFLGRLYGTTTPSGSEWNQLISRTERLLLVSHRPAHNASGLYRGKANDHFLHILNWGNRGDLLPEVSGSRYMGRFVHIPNYGPLGSHSQEETVMLDDSEPLEEVL